MSNIETVLQVWKHVVVENMFAEYLVNKSQNRTNSQYMELVYETATYRCDDTRICVIQFWPPDDEHMCSKHVEAWNKLIVKQKYFASSWLITETTNSTCFGRCFRPSSGAYHCNYSFWYCPPTLLLVGNTSENIARNM